MHSKSVKWNNSSPKEKKTRKDVEASTKTQQMMRFRLVSLFWILMVSTDAACSTDASLA